MKRSAMLLGVMLFFVGFARLCLAAEPLAWNGVGSRIIDGDSIEVKPDDTGEPVKIRLYGINCPEKGQRCHIEAKDFTRNRVYQKRVRVEHHKTQPNQTIAKVYDKEGRYLNLDLAQGGSSSLVQEMGPKRQTA